MKTLAFALALSLGGPPLALAAGRDFAFELVAPALPQGEASIVRVRLVDRRSGSPVPNAVIFAYRLDMAPDGMETMTTPLELIPSSAPGIYGFRTNLLMEGKWRLSIAAKVQGEAETVQGQIVLEVTP